MNVGAGYSRNAVNTVFENDPRFGTAVDVVGSGFAGGAQIGFNLQLGSSFVAGIEGDIGSLGIHHSVGDFNRDGASFDTKADWYGTIRGRFGYSTGPALLYGTAGVAVANVKSSIVNSFTFPGSSSDSKSETASGLTVGGGIEAALGQNWTAKTEYLYINAGSQDLSANIFSGPAVAAHFDNRLHVVRFGLNYAFGH